MKNYKVSVVTVTYGNRQHLLKKIILELNQVQLIDKIIVINNGSNLKEIKKNNFEKLKIVDLKENTGSANGFKIGLEKASQLSTTDFILILDDDNLPEQKCIPNLLNYYFTLKSNYKGSLALLAFREDRLDFQKVAKGKDSKKIFCLNNSFLGWHVKQVPSKLINKFKSRFSTKDNNKQLYPVEYAQVPLAPYGGLFFHKSLLDKIGFPNSNYYLYCDDYDFTYRINKVLGRIYLIPSSRIIDIDKSWFVKEKSGFFMSFLTSKSEKRIFYSIRNRVYFEQKNLVDNRIVYFINRYSFLLIVYILSIITRNKERYKMIIKSIGYGDKGRLGKI